MPERPTIQDLLTHADWVRHLAQRLVRDANAADDLVQETWLAALKHPGTAVHAPRGWLHEVTRRFAWQSARRKQPLPMEPGELATRDTTLEPDVIAERLELQQELTQAVLKLDSPYRRLVFLRYYEGLTPKEIAAREGLPVTTVSNRLSRALDQLRAALDEKHQGRSQWKALYVGVFGLGRAGATMFPVAVAALLLLVVGAGIFIATRPPDFVIGDPRPPASSAPRVDAVPDPIAPEPGLSARAFAPNEAPAALRQGRVLDETGQPVAGARVLIQDETAWATLETRWHEEAARTASPAEIATTDEEGRFQVRSELGSRAPLVVRAPGFGLGRITPNSEATMQCVLQRVAQTSLRILDRDGRPVTRATVWIRPPLWSSTTALHPWLDILESDPRGEVRIDHLGGDLTDSVMATAVRWVDAQELPQALLRVAANGFAPSRPFRLADLETSSDGARVLILDRAARGLITFESPDFASDAEAPRIWLRERGLVRSIAAPLSGPLALAIGNDGEGVEVASLSPQFVLVVTTPGARRLASGAYELRNSAGDQLVAHAHWVRVVPRRGRLLDAHTSAPLPFVEIAWQSAALGANPIAGTTTSDAQGEFRIAGHGGHGLRLWIHKGAVAADTLRGAADDRPLPSGEAGVVFLPAPDVEQEAELELRVASSPELRCRLRLPSGEVAPGVTMRASLSRAGLEALTLEAISDPDGAVQLSMPARGLPVLLRAEDARGYSFEQTLPPLDEGRDLGVVTLTRDLPVDFLVVDEGNRPLSGVTIRVLAAPAIRAPLEAADQTLVSDAEGRARLPFRGRGPARILAESRRQDGLSLSRRSPSALPLDISKPVVLRYETPHFIEADLRWDDGSPAASLSVWLVPESPHPGDAELLADLAAAGGRALSTLTEDEKQMLIGAHARTDAEGRLRVRVDDLRTYRPLRILRRDATTSTATTLAWSEGIRLRAGERPTLLPVFLPRSGVPR